MVRHSVNILFELRHAETSPGETLGVVGSLAELGTWDAYHSAIRLHTGATCYPLWSSQGPLQVSVADAGSISPASSSASSPRDQGSELSPSFATGPRAAGAAEAAPADDAAAGGDAAVAEASLAGSSELAQPTTLRFEYKYIKDRRQVQDRGPSIVWEDSIANRSVTISAEPGSMWTISDAGFNDSREAPRITRTSLVDVLRRRGDLDLRLPSPDVDGSHSPEWTTRGMDEEEQSWSSSDWNSHHTTSTVGACFLGGAALNDPAGRLAAAARRLAGAGGGEEEPDSRTSSTGRPTASSSSSSSSRCDDRGPPAEAAALA